MNANAGHNAMIASIASAFSDIKERINLLEQQVNSFLSNEVETISSFDEKFVITAARRADRLAQPNTRITLQGDSNEKSKSNRVSTRSQGSSANGSAKQRESDGCFVKPTVSKKRRLTTRKTTGIKNEVTNVSKFNVIKKQTINLRTKRKKKEPLKNEVAGELIPFNSRLARGKIVVNKMIIYDPLPEDNKNIRTFRVGRVLRVNRHSSTIVVHHYDTYNKNKSKMTGVRFRPAFSNDDSEAPMEVYTSTITKALVKRYGIFSRMYTSIPQKSVLLSFENLLPRTAQIPPEIILRYKKIKSQSIFRGATLMRNHALFSHCMDNECRIISNEPNPEERKDTLIP